jgi:hypothetical protein
MSLTFVYVEGDDAEVVAHHALGRDSYIAPVYAAYESMTDFTLSLLPAREDVVRITAMTVTALCMPIFFFLVMLLAFDWCNEILPTPRWPLVVVMLLAVPEFYYLGMVLEPPIIAMTFLVGAHLVVRRSTAGTPNWAGVAISILLFGLGAALRWETVRYGLTIAADLFFRYGNRRPEKAVVLERLRMTFLWGILAVIAWTFAVRLNGYGFVRMIRISRNTGLEPIDWKASFSSIHTLFTPGFAISFAVGLYFLLRRKHPLAFITLISFLPVGKLLLYGAPKYIITLTPSLLACGLVGFSAFWRLRWQRYMLITASILPWLIGVRMTFSGFAWGPGFEIQSYERIPTRTSWPSLTLGPGMAIPTREGPRALFGHAWVLGGGWKRFVTEYWSEQEAAVRKTIQGEAPILLQDPMQGWVSVSYAKNGYTTEDSYSRTIDSFVIERRWHSPDGTKSTMFKLNDPQQIFEPGGVERLRQIAGDTVIIIAFTRTLGNIYRISPKSMDRLGNTTAVLHLDRLSADLRNRQ